MQYMFSGANLSTANYDAILIGWNNLPSLQNNVTLDSSAHYCQGETARNNIISTYSWTINDAGKECNPPTVDTLTVAGIEPTSASGRGNISDTGGENPERFIEWGTTSGSYADQCTAGIGSTGEYSCVLTNLTPNTTYYVRAKAVNATGGTSYGSKVTFTTGTVSGATSQRVKIKGINKLRGIIKVK